MEAKTGTIKNKERHNPVEALEHVEKGVHTSQNKEIKTGKSSRESKELKELQESKDLLEKSEDKPKEDKGLKEERVREERIRDEKEREKKLERALKILAPGTQLRAGIDSILRGKMGALIVVGNGPQVMAAIEGGFNINSEFNPASLYELAKMDGAIILDSDAKRILYANTQLVPNAGLISLETGIRHRTAERMARQTGELILAISQRRSQITLYQGNMKYMLQDIGLLLVKANQALQTLEKYRMVLDKDLINLSALEFENMVTVFDVVRVIQRCVLVMKIVKEIEGYINELGTEGRLVSMQMKELIGNVLNEVLFIIQDYVVQPTEKSSQDIRDQLSYCSVEELSDLIVISRFLGYGATAGVLDLQVPSRGYRILQKIPRLPAPIIDNLVNAFEDLPSILKASIEELDEVEGIGEVRARAIKNGLKRLQEQVILDQRI